MKPEPIHVQPKPDANPPLGDTGSGHSACHRLPQGRTTFRRVLTGTVPLWCGLLALLPTAAADLHVPAQYATIQAAVDAAAPGDTIRIGPGVYVEQILVVSKKLTLAGSPGAVLRAKPGMTATLRTTGLPVGGVDATVPLFAAVKSEVVLQGLTFEGEHLDEGYSASYSAITFSGTSGKVEDCIVRGFRGARYLDLTGYGFVAANDPALETPAVHLEIRRCTFADNGMSITIRGPGRGSSDPTIQRLTFSIVDNTIAGVGPTDLGSQVGIWIGAGASGEVKRNTIRDHCFADTDPKNPATHGSPTFPSMGIVGLDIRFYFFGLSAPADLLPVVFEDNTFVNNQHHLALFKANGTRVLNNTFQGTGTAWRPTGVLLSGEETVVEHNRFSEIPTGITLLGDDPAYGGTLFGVASGGQLLANRFCEVTTPIETQTGATHAAEQGTLVCPFPPPALAIAPAVILTWTGETEGWILESAPAVNGPWTPSSATPSPEAGQNTVAVPTDAQHAYFRLRSP